MTRPIDEVAIERRLRAQWALARMGETINAARELGWMSGAPSEDVDSSQRLLAKLGVRAADTTPMAQLGDRLVLGAVEMNALWLLATIELDPQVSAIAQMVAAPGQHQLSAMMLEQLASDDDDSACDGEALERLVQLGLVEGDVSPSVPLYRRTVRVNDRVVDLVRGKLALDRELAKLATLVPPAATGHDLEVPRAVVHAMASGQGATLVVAVGIEGSGRLTLLREAAARAGKALLVVRAAGLAGDLATATRQLRAVRRECCLHDAWPLLVDVDGLGERVAIVERELLAPFAGLVLATARASVTWASARSVLGVTVAIPDETSRAAMWQRALPAAGADVVAECARRYTISPGMLGRAAGGAVALAREEPLKVGHVHLALRAQLEKQLLGLATRVETTQCWRDLVMPNDQLELLAELVARVKHRQQVLETWGFAAKVGRGVGLSVLLSGPPGTGKTMVAGLVARELGLDLYQVDLSKIVSKYIGETEKQLAQLFDAAESGHSILLFDEADSMFGKRTEVRSSNDRYANLEVNYLLQRMEAFAGITILTTNHETAIDPAFQRRLAMHVRVPMPDEKHRADLWQTMLPEAADVRGPIDFARLAGGFVMSGGYIKNAVVRAAYLAADDGSAITDGHLLRAAHAEYEGMGKVTQRAAM